MMSVLQFDPVIVRFLAEHEPFQQFNSRLYAVLLGDTDPVGRVPAAMLSGAISAGVMRTLSLAGITGGRSMYAKGRELSALQEDTSMEGVAGCALWLLSDLGRSTTGEVVHVDAGFHMMGLPSQDEAAPSPAPAG